MTTPTTRTATSSFRQPLTLPLSTTSQLTRSPPALPDAPPGHIMHACTPLPHGWMAVAAVLVGVAIYV